MSTESILQIDETTASWVASLYLFGAALGPFFSSTITKSIGYKWTFISFNISLLLSWLALARVWSTYIFYVARFLSGITVGMIYLTIPLYVAEVSEDSLRGAMNSFLLAFRCIGILMEFAVGPYVSYHLLIIINAIAPLLYLLCSLRMPESPYYLLTKGKTEDAVKTVAWLRGGIPLPSAETITSEMQTFLDQTLSEKKSMKDLFATSGNVKGLLITGILLALQPLCGSTVMLFYTEQLFSMTGGDISADISAIIYGGMYLLGSLFGPGLAKRYGFRKPLIMSGILVFLAQFVLGTYLFFYSNGFDVNSITWLPIVCALIYAGVFNCAMGAMPWALMGEIFPPNIKEQAAAIVTSVCFLSAFLTTKFFPLLSEILGIYTVFWMFASVGLFCSVFTIFFVPNTKGLSLDQIQNKLNKTTKSKDINETP